MSKSRVIFLYGLFLVLLLVVLGRVYLTAENRLYAQKADDQTITDLALPRERGNFYDRKGRKLTGAEKEYYVLCVPGESSYVRLFNTVDYATQAMLYQRRNSAAPFLVSVKQDLSPMALYCYPAERRYLSTPIAQHILGYLDVEGHGVSGLEAVYDTALFHRGERSLVQCVTNGAGGLLEGFEPKLLEETGNRALGIQLTLDEALQRECEGIADTVMERGCILVLDTQTGEVLASVSRPEFDQYHISRAIESDDTSLINRAVSQFTVGSVFKPVVAAAAIKRGLDWFTLECEGSVEVDGLTFRCAKGIAHGDMDLQGALEQSCNCYFIQLGLQLGRDDILDMAEQLGLGKEMDLNGLRCAAGNLPETETLTQLGQLANFSFGQGQLLATPVQIAAMMNAIAADGNYRRPSLVRRVVDVNTGETAAGESVPSVSRVLTPKQAEGLREMLCGVVEQGTGRRAAPERLGAGGKTGTAQTGRYSPTGEEYMNYWFAGFYPAEQPQYTIVILQDETVEPDTSCAAIFAQICNALYYGKTVDIPQKGDYNESR